MAKAIAITRKRFTPLDLAVSTTVSGALNQTYDAAYQSYDPDRGLIPLDIIVTVRATDPAGVISPGIINKSLTDIRWHENVVDDSHNILDSDTRYVIDRTGDTDERGKITVKVNTPLEGVVLIFTAKYNDPRDGKVLSVSASVSLGVTMSTDEPLRVKTDYPYGQVVDPTENRDLVEIDNVMYRGDRESEGTLYRWQEKNGSDYTDIAEGDKGITGAYTGKLKVPCASVGKRMELRCVSDVLPDLAGVNLVSLDGICAEWNALKSGIATPGEDADGKYWEVSQKLLFATLGGSKTDILFEKIKYKPNQQYRLDVMWKMHSEHTENSHVFIFHISYKDGSSSEIRLRGKQSTITTQSLISDAGKTIDSIGISYGLTTINANLYSLQLVEYHGENLVEGGSKEKTINSSFVYNITSAPAKNYSVRFDKSETITATGVTSRSFLIYDRTMSSIVSNIVNVNDGECGVITVNDDIDTSHKFGVVAYSKQGAGGGSSKFYNLMLVEGEYTDDTMPSYTPAAGEFVPAIADGGERWQDLTGNEITTDHVLSTRYPVCDTEIVAPAMLLDETSVFEARAVMHSNRGDIQNPELYWSFPWKDKSGAIFARGSKVFIDESQFSNGELEYSVEPVEGLGEAKWAASFNGIDQGLQIPSQSDIDPFGKTSNKKNHVVDFIVDSISFSIPCSVIYGDNGFIPVITSTGELKMYVKDKTVVSSSVSSPIFKAEAGKLYRLETSITADGVFTVKINGNPVGVTFENAGTFLNRITIGKGPSVDYFNGKVLKYEVYSDDRTVYHCWDFHPNNGDRANMLKNKDANGAVKGTLNLTPVNVPNIDVVDPENGFFVTI